ncbi:MAG: tetratricopeptide repeat protein [Bacteroidales bacterium]|nr:tetratricopeptide repeat protein [Bacteroidales bacterium]
MAGVIRVIIITMVMGWQAIASGQRVTGLSAGEAFARGEYEKAYEHYTILLESFPRDPLYLYGAGVSLVRQNLKPEAATSLLERSLEYSSSMREVPADAVFYLGRAYQLQGRFGEAVDSYNLFISNAGRREARSYDVQNLIRECESGIGKISDLIDDEPVPTEAIEALPVSEPEEIKPSQTMVPISGRKDSLLTVALNLRYASDSLAGEPQRGTSVPTLSRTLAARSDSLMSLAGLKISIPVEDIVKENTRVRVDTIADEVSQAADTSKPERPSEVKVKTGPFVSAFAIKTPPHYSETVPVPVLPAFPSGLVYTVQLAVFRNPVAPSHFRRLYPVFGIKNTGSDLTYYYSGLFRKADDASRVIQSIRDEGFRDAFVVIFMDGKQVSQERGSILEREWGNRDLPDWGGVNKAEQILQVRTDTVPPTLLFRVEVLRTNKEVNPQLADELSKIASGRGLEIMNPSTDIYVYLVGKFLTFESASEYADLLKRNGYKDSRVAAYLGNREIPVETALKFFYR